MYQQREEEPDQGDYEEPKDNEDMNEREMTWNTTEIPTEEESYENEINGEQIERCWSKLEDDTGKKMPPMEAIMALASM